MTYVIGIDPGLKGGWCAIPINESDRGNAQAEPLPIAGKFVDVRALFSPLADFMGVPALVAIEQQGARPQDGFRSLNTMLPNFGAIWGAVQMLGWPMIMPTPQAWKKVILAGTPRDKNAAIAYATRRHPWANLRPGRLQNPHDGIADAICIAAWALTQV